MKTLSLSLLAMGIGLWTPSIQAAPFDHPCEVLYWKMNKEEDSSQRSLLNRRFSTCVDQFGETKLIKEAKEYLRDSVDHEAKVEEQVQEQIEIAKGKRSGKIVVELSEEEIINHENNPLGAPLVSDSEIFEKGKIKTYETSADNVCKYLGYDKSIDHRKSDLYDSGKRSDRSEMPAEALELRKKGFFGGFKTEPIVHRVADRKKLSYGFAYRYYTSISCEREIKEGEDMQDFDIDINEITRVVNAKMEPPKLKDDVARILSLSRSNPKTAVGEDASEDGGEFRTKEWDDNPFIYSSTIRQ